MYVWILFLVLESGKQMVDEYESEQACYDALMGTALGHAVEGFTVTQAYCDKYTVVGNLLNTIEESKESILAEPRR